MTNRNMRSIGVLRVAAVWMLAAQAAIAVIPETNHLLKVGGQLRAAVIVAEAKALPQARLLAQRLKRMTDREVKVCLEADAVAGDAVAIHVGQTAYVESLNLNLDALHPAGYCLLMPDTDHLVMAGRFAQGTSFAVEDFLKRFGGYRWFMPGELGEVLPRCDYLELPSLLNMREEPSFATYYNAGLYGGNGAFSRSGRVTMYATHWFYHIFPPAIYGKSNPEYYPMIDGNRFVPPDKLAGTWQPCISNPDLPELAVAFARQYFKEHPDKLSVPMGVNDGLGDCKCPACTALLKAYGNQYIPFYNAVAKRLRQEFPDKLVSFIAYGGARVSPRNIRLEPGIHVEIASGLHDNLSAMREWQEAGASSIGLYDYLYGPRYVVPRHYPHVMADAWRKAYRKHGLQGGWFETFTQIWLYDGPRQYVLNELAWNLNTDVDALLEDYFSQFYGAAGPSVRRVFDRHEAVYRRRHDPLHPMDDWGQVKQLADYTRTDLDAMRRWLDDAEHALVAEDDPAPAARLALLRKVHGLSERMIETEIVIRELAAVEQVQNLHAVKRIVTAIEAGFRLKAEIDAYEMNEAEEKAIFNRTTLQGFRTQPTLQPGPRLEAQADRLLSQAVAMIEADAGWQAARDFCFDLARNAVSPAFRGVALTPVYIHETPDAGGNLIVNGDCEPAAATAAASEAYAHLKQVDWHDLKAPGWGTWHFQQTVTRFLLDTADAHSGTHSLAIGENNYSGSFMQGVRAHPGCRYRLSFWVKQTPAGRGGSASVRWQGKSGWLDESGNAAPRIALPYPNDTPSAWRKISVTFTAPADPNAPDAPVSALLLLSAPGGQKQDERINFDTVSLIKIFDPASPLIQR